MDRFFCSFFKKRYLSFLSLIQVVRFFLRTIPIFTKIFFLNYAHLYAHWTPYKMNVIFMHTVTPKMQRVIVEPLMNKYMHTVTPKMYIIYAHCDP